MVEFYRRRQIVMGLFFVIMLAGMTVYLAFAPEPLQPYPAPAFEFRSSQGQPVVYGGSQGPALIVFSRPGDTAEEVELDLQALKYAKESPAKVFVIGLPDVAPALKGQTLAPQGTDPEGRIAARFPTRPGEHVAWVVVDLKGVVRWSGSRSSLDLKAKLAAL